MLPDFLEGLTGTDFEGFEPSEVRGFLNRYVCSQCTGELESYQLPGDRIFIIYCPNCKENVEQLGAVSKTTVSIRYEEAKRDFYRAVRNLKDLYPGLQTMVELHRSPLQKGETEEMRNLRELGF